MRERDVEREFHYGGGGGGFSAFEDILLRLLANKPNNVKRKIIAIEGYLCTIASIAKTCYLRDWHRGVAPAEARRKEDEGAFLFLSPSLLQLVDSGV